jgi:hypothetical protein
MKIMVWFLFCLQCFQMKRYIALDIWPWKTMHVFLSLWGSNVPCMIMKLTVQSRGSLSCIKGFPVKWYYDFDLWPWQTIGIFLLSWGLNVPSCNILKLTVWILSCLQGFHIRRKYDINFWLLTLTMIGIFLSSWESKVSSCQIPKLTILSYLQGLDRQIY